MIYIKNYYDRNDYYNIVNRFFNFFIKENFLNISSYEYELIFHDISNKLVNDLINKKIKSDKKLFKTIKENIIYLSENNNILKNTIIEQKIYNIPISFKSNDYKTYNNYFNRNFLLLEFKKEYI